MSPVEGIASFERVTSCHSRVVRAGGGGVSVVLCFVLVLYFYCWP